MNGEEVLAVIGLVLIVAGVIVMIVPMVRATLGGSALAQTPPELTGLTAQELAGLRRQVQANGAFAPSDRPKLQALAEGMVARRIGVFFCLGAGIAALGIAVTDPTDPIRVIFFVVIVTVTAVTTRVVLARAEAGRMFLDQHPR